MIEHKALRMPMGLSAEGYLKTMEALFDLFINDGWSFVAATEGTIVFSRTVDDDQG